MKLVSLFCAALPLAALPQWTQLYPDVWNGLGDPTYRSTIMTSAGAGFHALSVYYSPSSGGAYSIYRTEDDWGSAESLCSESFLITPRARELTRASADGMFYIHDFGPNMVRYLTVAGQQTSDLLSEYSIVGPLAVVDDTVCFWMTRNSWTSSDTLLVMKSYAHAQVSYALGLVVLPVNGRPALAFRDQTNGVLAVQDTSETTSLFVTHDSGQEWDLRLTVPGVFLHEISFLDDNTIWAVGDEGIAYRSQDGGESWGEIDLATTEDLWSVSGYSADSIWVSGADGLVLVSGSAGYAWTDRSVSGATIWKIQTLDSAVYAYGPEGQVWRYDPFVGVQERPSGDVLRHSVGPYGITFLLPTDEKMQRIDLFDAAGRKIQAPVYGQTMDMRSLASGRYLARVVSSKHEWRSSFFWGPVDR